MGKKETGDKHSIWELASTLIEEGRSRIVNPLNLNSLFILSVCRGSSSESLLASDSDLKNAVLQTDWESLVWRIVSPLSTSVCSSSFGVTSKQRSWSAASIPRLHVWERRYVVTKWVLDSISAQSDLISMSMCSGGKANSMGVSMRINLNRLESAWVWACVVSRWHTSTSGWDVIIVGTREIKDVGKSAARLEYRSFSIGLFHFMPVLKVVTFHIVSVCLHSIVSPRSVNHSSDDHLLRSVWQRLDSRDVEGCKFSLVCFHWSSVAGAVLR